MWSLLILRKKIYILQPLLRLALPALCSCLCSCTCTVFSPSQHGFCSAAPKTTPITSQHRLAAQAHRSLHTAAALAMGCAALSLLLHIPGGLRPVWNCQVVHLVSLYIRV